MVFAKLALLLALYHPADSFEVAPCDPLHLGLLHRKVPHPPLADQVDEGLRQLDDVFGLDRMIRDTEREIELAQKLKLDDALVQKAVKLLEKLKQRKRDEQRRRAEGPRIRELEGLIQLYRKMNIPEADIKPCADKLEALRRELRTAPPPRPVVPSK